jgi:hypothetical protein
LICTTFVFHHNKLKVITVFVLYSLYFCMKYTKTLWVAAAWSCFVIAGPLCWHTNALTNELQEETKYAKLKNEKLCSCHFGGIDLLLHGQTQEVLTAQLIIFFTDWTAIHRLHLPYQCSSFIHYFLFRSYKIEQNFKDK